MINVRFEVFFIFISIIITLITLLTYLVFKEKVILKFLFRLVIFLLFSYLLFVTVFFIKKKTNVESDDLYGTYIVDRKFFKGKNADWQYNHYRFEITNDDELNLYITDESKVLKVYKRKIQFIEGGASPHLKIINENPNFILEAEPTLYRNSWDFYLVFKTKPYSNMFFKKGNWKPINN